MHKRYDIFISYRREGGYETAKHLYDLLTRDGYKVSFDLDTLRNGDFDTELLLRIEQCKDFILIVNNKAFERTLDPTSPKEKDWLRCELAYALEKKKNIIPIFLAGTNGFPDGLPSDIAAVVKKNGPQYNRYYFDDFYKRLKRDFLSVNLSRRIPRVSQIFMMAFFVIFSIVTVLFFLPNMWESVDRTDSLIAKDTSNEINSEMESNMSTNRAKGIVVDVLGRKPIYAFGYSEDKDKIVAVLNENENEDDAPGGYFSWSPQLRMVILEKVAGVWTTIKDQKLNMHAIIHGQDDCFLQCEFDEVCLLYKSNGRLYLYFHIQRTIGGNATANIVNSFVCLSLLDSKMSVMEYEEDIDNIYSKNGDLIKDDYYPEGIEEYLLHKLEIDKSLEKTE